MYDSGDYDLAGFAVGAAERDGLLPTGVAAGDAVLGLASTGVHSNGYSLVRRVVAASGLGWNVPAPFAPDQTLGQALMTPTRIYVKSLLALHRAGLLKAAAHITGGGLPGNLPRVLPQKLDAVIDTHAWKEPAIFQHIRDGGKIDRTEMYQVFNMGIGMAVVVGAGDWEKAAKLTKGRVIGHIEKGSGVVQLEF